MIKKFYNCNIMLNFGRHICLRIVTASPNSYFGVRLRLPARGESNGWVD